MFIQNTGLLHYPHFKELRENRKLFESGRLSPGGFGIDWTNKIDFETQSIYDLGVVVGQKDVPLNKMIGVLLSGYRSDLGMTQKELANTSGINQADISRIEDGKGNPTLKKVEKLFSAMGKTLEVSCK
ncbi:MAG: helix-turn-helix transcriptional regulator [Bacilli bacterium]|nr:helix-turn-helix transcriptional regulator [Bacilli bacterium]